MDTVKHNKLFLSLGVIGSFLKIYGYLFQIKPELFFITGAVALMTTAIAFRLFYFIALEFILAAGHTALVLGLGLYIQVALPVLLCFQLVIFYLMSDKREHSFSLIIGVMAVLLLSLGFSYNNQWIFFSGSLGIAGYALYEAYKGLYPCYIWAALNGLFAFIALYKIIEVPL